MYDTFFAQACVQLPKGGKYTIKYSLVSMQPAEGIIYGITIDLIYGTDILESSTAYAWQSPEKAQEYILSFSKNFLFPCHLHEIVNDL